MKTMSGRGLRIRTADEAYSTPRTFSLGVVQAIVTVRKNLSCLSYHNSLCRRPVERNQAFAAKHHGGTSVTQSFDLYLCLAISIDGVDPSKRLL